MVMPYTTSQRSGIAGRRTKKIAGNATSVNRSPASKKGGMPCKPSLITTKFTPHATTTHRANNISFTDIRIPQRGNQAVAVTGVAISAPQSSPISRK